MSYCTIEEAWGSSQLLNKPKKSKNKHRNRYKDNHNTHNTHNTHTSNLFKNERNQTNYKNGSTRDIHNRLTRKNRFITKNINQDVFDLQVSTSPESNKLRNNNKKVLIPSPVSLNDDYDNYQELDYEIEDKSLLDEYAENNYIDTNTDLNTMNNPEMMPNSDCISVASYDDLEDNYHEMGTDKYASVNLEDNHNQSRTVTNKDNYNLNNTDNEIVQEEDNLEGFQNANSNLNTNTNLNTNSNLSNNELAHIMDRLDNLEKMIKQKKSDNNNVHDIILFIIIGVFILFALDSIFKIGRGTI